MVQARARPLAGVGDLARACGLSEAVLRQAVAAATGLPAARFVRSLRLRTSAAWLTRREFARAAEVAGYETQEAYAKAFKSEFGQSPSRFAEMTTVCSVNARLVPDLAHRDRTDGKCIETDSPP
jgi:AraC-like DNA-binding protein